LTTFPPRTETAVPKRRWCRAILGPFPPPLARCRSGLGLLLFSCFAQKPQRYFLRCSILSLPLVSYQVSSSSSFDARLAFPDTGTLLQARKRLLWARKNLCYHMSWSVLWFEVPPRISNAAVGMQQVRSPDPFFPSTKDGLLFCGNHSSELHGLAFFCSPDDHVLAFSLFFSWS